MSGDISVRLATCADHAALENLLRRAALAGEKYREALLAHPETLQLPLKQIEAKRVYVAERTQEIVGFSVVLPRPDGDADLDGLFVEPTQWKQGIGRRLMQAAERLALLENATSIHVVANPQAQGFYAACAFAPVGEEQTRFGPAVVMRKQL